MAMRVYALYEKSRLVLASVCMVGVAVLIFSIVSLFLQGTLLTLHIIPIISGPSSLLPAEQMTTQIFRAAFTMLTRPCQSYTDFTIISCISSFSLQVPT